MCGELSCDTLRSDGVRMRKFIRVVTLPGFGALILLVGTVYGVLFAGVPYPDPTPEQQARYEYHYSVFSRLFDVGAVVFLAGLLAVPIVLKVTKHAEDEGAAE